MKWVLATAHALAAVMFIGAVLFPVSLPAPWAGLLIMGLMGLSIFTVAWVLKSRID